MEWQGKTALITGGVSGIGFGIARVFSAAGVERDFAEIYRDCVTALPNEPAPEARLQIERLRREANRAAAAGKVISLGDLT